MYWSGLRNSEKSLSTWLVRSGQWAILKRRTTKATGLPVLNTTRLDILNLLEHGFGQRFSRCDAGGLGHSEREYIGDEKRKMSVIQLYLYHFGFLMSVG